MIMDGRAAWLARLRHDLCKRLLWPARDRRDLGGAVVAGELVVSLTDDEGTPIEAAALWAKLRAEAPAGASPAALDAFGSAVATVSAAAARDDMAGVLALESAFEALARNMK